MCVEVEARVDIILGECEPDRSTICSSEKCTLPKASPSVWPQSCDTSLPSDEEALPSFRIKDL